MTRVLQRDELLLYCAFLPALLTLIGLGFTAAVQWHDQTVWHFAPTSVTTVGADDYVEGLARLGIIRLPGYELLRTDGPKSPAVAAE
jgi:hypothetical protein